MLLTIWTPRKNNLIVIMKFYKMFDLKELKLMFLDPTDLIINNINKYLCSNKTIKLIFFYEEIILLIALQNYFHIMQKMLKMEK